MGDFFQKYRFQNLEDNDFVRWNSIWKEHNIYIRLNDNVDLSVTWNLELTDQVMVNYDSTEYS